MRVRRAGTLACIFALGLSVCDNEARAGGEAKTVHFAVSIMNESMVGDFESAWRSSGGGVMSIESVILMYRKPDGSFAARRTGRTNEHKKFTFKMSSDVVAIIHTHPNSEDPRPNGRDRQVADEFGVPIFTITRSGMYGYDPSCRKVFKVMDGLDWLRPEKWNETVAARVLAQR